MTLAQLLEFVDALRPRYVVPMHYGVPHLAMAALPVASLVEMWPTGRVRAPSAPDESTFVVVAGPGPADFPLLCPLRPLRQRQTN